MKLPDFVIERLAPGTTPGEAAITRQVAGIAVLAFVISLVIAGTYAVLETTAVALVSVVVAGSACLLGPVIYKLTGRKALAAHWYASLTCAVIIITAWLRGGFPAPPLMYLLLLPIVCVYLDRLRSAVVWVALSAVVIAAFYWLFHTGNSPTPQMAQSVAELALLDAVGVICLLFLILGLLGAEVSKREDAAIERRRAEQRLAIVERTETIGQLAAGVAHDFNNLLTVILSSAALARGGVATDSDAAEDLDAIIQAGQKGTILTKRLLLYRREDAQEPELIDAGNVINALKVLLSRTLPARIRLDYLLETDLPPILFSPSTLEQILINLIVNAKDAIRGPGVVTVILTRSPDREFVELRVKDTGSGMDAETLKRATEAFFTTKPAGRGTGLGLWSAADALTRAGGSLDVQSGSTGTTVCIRIPAQPNDRAPGIRKKAQETDSARSQATILVVDDHEHVLRATTRALTRAGHEVLGADRGATAMRVLETRGDDVDLVLTDVVMPEMSGFQLAEEIRKSFPELRVLFMTGRTPRNAISMSRVLLKPFDPSTLLRRIQKELDPGSR